MHVVTIRLLQCRKAKYFPTWNNEIDQRVVIGFKWGSIGVGCRTI